MKHQPMKAKLSRLKTFALLPEENCFIS